MPYLLWLFVIAIVKLWCSFCAPPVWTLR